METHIPLITAAGTKIKNIIKGNSYSENENSVLYEIPFSACNTLHFGEIVRKSKKTSQTLNTQKKKSKWVNKINK